MSEIKPQTKPATRQVEAFRRWIGNYNPSSDMARAFVILAGAFERQLDSDCYREAGWSSGEFHFVTDSEHLITLKVTDGTFKAGTLQRKARFWAQVKATDVTYRNWQVFGEALRELDIQLVGFKNIPNGFIAGFVLNVGDQLVTFSLRATPTERFELNRDYSPVHAAERMAPF